MKHNSICICICSIIFFGIISPITLSAAKQPSSKLLDISRTALLKKNYFILENILSKNEKMFEDAFKHLKNKTLEHFCRYIYYTQKKQFLDSIQTPETWGCITEAIKSKNQRLILSGLGTENINNFQPYVFSLISVVLPNLSELYICNSNLTKLSKLIGNLTNLTRLDLCANNLTELPKSIGNLTNLTTFSITNNQIETLPDSINNLTNLIELNLHKNKIRELPLTINNLTNLKELRLQDNPLKTIAPLLIKDKLKNLELLILPSNLTIYKQELEQKYHNTKILFPLI